MDRSHTYTTGEGTTTDTFETQDEDYAFDIGYDEAHNLDGSQPEQPRNTRRNVGSTATLGISGRLLHRGLGSPTDDDPPSQEALPSSLPYSDPLQHQHHQRGTTYREGEEHFIQGLQNILQDFEALEGQPSPIRHLQQLFPEQRLEQNHNLPHDTPAGNTTHNRGSGSVSRFGQEGYHNREALEIPFAIEQHRDSYDDDDNGGGDDPAALEAAQGFPIDADLLQAHMATQNAASRKRTLFEKLVKSRGGSGRGRGSKNLQSHQRQQHLLQGGTASGAAGSTPSNMQAGQQQQQQNYSSLSALLHSSPAVSGGRGGKSRETLTKQAKTTTVAAIRGPSQVIHPESPSVELSTLFTDVKRGTANSTGGETRGFASGRGGRGRGRGATASGSRLRQPLLGTPTATQQQQQHQKFSIREAPLSAPTASTPRPTGLPNNSISGLSSGGGGYSSRQPGSGPPPTIRQLVQGPPGTVAPSTRQNRKHRLNKASTPHDLHADGYFNDTTDYNPDALHALDAIEGEETDLERGNAATVIMDDEQHQYEGGQQHQFRTPGRPLPFFSTDECDHDEYGTAGTSAHATSAMVAAQGTNANDDDANEQHRTPAAAPLQPPGSSLSKTTLQRQFISSLVPKHRGLGDGAGGGSFLGALGNKAYQRVPSGSGLYGRMQAINAAERAQQQHALSPAQQPEGEVIRLTVLQSQLDCLMTQCMCRCGPGGAFVSERAMAIFQPKTSREVDLGPGSVVLVGKPWRILQGQGLDVPVLLCSIVEQGARTT